jgi:hypothetical protein
MAVPPQREAVLERLVGSLKPGGRLPARGVRPRYLAGRARGGPRHGGAVAVIGGAPTVADTSLIQVLALGGNDQVLGGDGSDTLDGGPVRDSGFEGELLTGIP